MLGIEKYVGHYRAEPSTFGRLSVNGHVKREGRGIAGYFLTWRTSIEAVPVTALNQPFVFGEITKDNQELTLQGGFVYKVEDPCKLLGTYDFSIDPETKEYMGDGITKLPDHVLQLVRAETRGLVQDGELEKLLSEGESLSREVNGRIQECKDIASLGVHVELLYFSSLKPKPEIAKALEAGYREALLQKADSAIYARRAEAVAQERVIKENEIATDIRMEEERKKLVALQIENETAEAASHAEALRAELKALEGIDPELLRAHALYQIGHNAARIESLTITPDVLAGIRDAK